MFTFHCAPLIMSFYGTHWEFLSARSSQRETVTRLALCMFECVQFANSMHPLLNLHLNHQRVTWKLPVSVTLPLCSYGGRVLWYSDYRMHGCVLSWAAELFFLWEQVLFKEVAVTCWLVSPSVSPRYSLLHEVTSATQKKEGACLREGMPGVRKDLPADAGPVTILLKTYRFPNRECQAVFGRAAAAAAGARCCLWHTATASAVESTDTTRTRGLISLRLGPMTRLSCRDSGNRDLLLRLRTWKTSWRWTALPWRSVCPIRQAWSTGKREAELGTDMDTRKTWTERLRTSRW